MQQENVDFEKIKSTNLFPVVGIGASAGGLDAFKKLISGIPEQSGMAYILVQHLDPSHESILSNLLQRVTRIPVSEITDNMQVIPDHIYIIPSNKLLIANDGILQLSPRPPKSTKNMPVDLFFESLAEVHQSHAIGVVLSGKGADGTLGLKKIKEHGGTTIVQDPKSASYDSMPQNAINAGVVDYSLPAEKIAEHLFLLNERKKENIPKLRNSHEIDETNYQNILSLLYTRRGVDFTHYKQTTIRRRINRRLAISIKGGLVEYLAYLKDNTAEQDILYQDLLIPVTQFFRDTKVFDSLCTTVFPALLKDRAENDPLRIWIAGCSTGEEAYSIVMCLYEYLGVDSGSMKVQVFATDISDVAIIKARSGIYNKREISSLSPERQQKFFKKIDSKYRLNKNIRDTCIFAYHNYLKDPPFAKIDLISCRNSLIYIEPQLQKKVLTLFHYALKDKGFLLLGKSETTGLAIDLYNVFDKNSKIYTRKSVRSSFKHTFTERNEAYARVGELPILRKEISKEDYQKNADDLLLAKYAPPGVIVNNDLDIVQFRGATGMWLEASPGKPNLNVIKMVREGLTFELRNILHKVKSSQKPIIKENIPIQFMGTEHLTTLEVIPLLNSSEPYYLILFKDATVVVDNETSSVNDTTAATPKQSKERLRISNLQLELAHARQDMSRITEDQEAINQDLQSANEELVSGSEELQSLNEELETSKEEIQTSNEELIIVNQEIYDRNEQLNLSRIYAESIVTTIREPLIILNKDLVVKSANRAFYNHFQTSAGKTEGLLLYDLGNKQWNIPALRKMLEKILPKKTSIVDYEVAHNFPFIGQRIMLLNATQIFRDNNEEQSILLAFEDITEKRKTDNELKVFSELLEKQVSERTFSLHEANADLLHSNENLEQFAYIASHDLQEPLRKIRIFSTLLQDRFNKELPEGARELILKIITSSERMSTLIKAVLNFSKILHNDNAFEQTDLNDVLSDIIADFDLLISEKKAIVYREKLPVIKAIPLQINQLFYNLISNSLKYSKKGTAPVITITSRRLTANEVYKHQDIDQKRNYCEISFKDNGIGFQQQFSDQIFLIFNRLHPREQFSGTGIGLALCKKIVLNHHGKIYAFSNEEEGALFQILLPIED